VKKVAFMHREKVRSAVNLSGAGVDDLDGRVVFAARFKNKQLGPAIDVEVHKRIFHGIEVACLAGEVEQIVLALDQVSHTEFITNVGDVDANPAFMAIQIEEITPVLGDKAVYDRHPGP
jgi:hypothetical protein